MASSDRPGWSEPGDGEGAMIAPPWGYTASASPRVWHCQGCGTFGSGGPDHDHHDKTCATFRLESTVEAMARALEKALPGFAELHGQGIGCPDCPDEDYVERPHPDGPAVCPAYRQIEAALASWRALAAGKEVA